MESDEPTAADLGEAGLLEVIARRAPVPPPGEVWVGDDAAVLASPGAQLLLTTDLLVERVDFDLRWSSGSDVGYKAVAVNVSDVAAMGGRPHYGVATLSLPPHAAAASVIEILDGLEAGAQRWDLHIVGGDISKAAEITIALALLGTPVGRPVLRSGAHTGEAICVTGTLGASAGGLLALRDDLQGRADDIDGLIARHLRPEPRLREGQVLAEAKVSSMIDISDGLGLDLSRLMNASGTGCRIEPAAIPVEPALHELKKVCSESLDPLQLALAGGEDFELLFTCGAELVPRVTDDLVALGTSCTVIGEVSDAGMYLGEAPMKGGELGWDHLRSR